MSVQYVAVGYKSVLLAEAGLNSKLQFQYQSQVEQMLIKFQDKGDLSSSNTESATINFYVVKRNDVVCIAFTDKFVTKSQSYGMCNEILNQFSNNYPPSTLQYAEKLKYNSEFGASLRNGMKNIQKYSSKVQELQAELTQVKSLVMDNINQVMKRGTQLEEIETDAIDTRKESEKFKMNALKLKNQMRCKRIGMTVGVISGIVLLLLVIILPLALK